MSKADFDKNNEINYSEFIVATLSKKFLDNEYLGNFFNVLDIHGEKKLCAEGLVGVFKR